MTLTIRRRLLIRLISAIAISWLVTILFVYTAAYYEVDEIYDAALAQQSRVLATLMIHESEEEMEVRQMLRQLSAESDVEQLNRSPLFRKLLNEYLERGIQQDYLTLIDRNRVPGHRYESKIAFIIVDADNKVLLRSDLLVNFGEFSPGFSDHTMDGKQWRILGLLEPTSQMQVQVGEQYGIRRETVEYIVFHSLWPLFMTLPLVAFVIWLTVGNGLSPLRQIAATVERRDPNSLIPISSETIPGEVVPMVESLNRLFARVQDVLDHERRFTADAAHELRTPLAALKTMAQAKQLGDHNGQHQIFLQQIIAGVDRTSHLLEQLLTLARMESQNMSMKLLQRIDLNEQVLETITEIGPMALDRDIDITYKGEESGVMVKGYRPALRILLRNLIDNAIRYTPTYGQIKIQIAPVPSEALNVCLTIEDTGPGIAQDQISKLFQRFRRGEATREEGSGLGLSIVRRIIELHRGRIEMENIISNPGLRVSVFLPKV
jgi:two-component system sensor histidine kinase QseC